MYEDLMKRFLFAPEPRAVAPPDDEDVTATCPFCKQTLYDSAGDEVYITETGVAVGCSYCVDAMSVAQYIQEH